MRGGARLDGSLLSRRPKPMGRLAPTGISNLVGPGGEGNSRYPEFGRRPVQGTATRVRGLLVGNLLAPLATSCSPRARVLFGKLGAARRAEC